MSEMKIPNLFKIREAVQAERTGPTQFTPFFVLVAQRYREAHADVPSDVAPSWDGLSDEEQISWVSERLADILGASGPKPKK